MIRYLYCKANGIKFMYGGGLGIVDAFIDSMFAFACFLLYWWLA